MPSELKMELRKRSDGVLRAIITSVDKPIRQMLLNRREYYEKARAYLKKAGSFDQIWVEIDSQGGSIDSASGIVAALCQQTEPMRILIDGSCHSAATLFLELPAPVYMTERSSIYVHSPSRQRYQRQKDGSYKLVATEKFGMKIAKAYFVETFRLRTNRTKHKTRKKIIREWIENGQRWKADQALEAGLCDGVMTRTEFEKGGK